MREALQTLEFYKEQEPDHDHMLEIERIRIFLKGVYEIGRTPPTRKSLENVEKVLKSIGPKDQVYTDEETAKQEIEEALEKIQ